MLTDALSPSEFLSVTALSMDGIELVVGSQERGWERPRRPSPPHTVVLTILIQLRELSRTMGHLPAPTHWPHTQKGGAPLSLLGHWCVGLMQLQ